MVKPKKLVLNSLIGILAVLMLLLSFPFANFREVSAYSSGDHMPIISQDKALKFEDLSWAVSGDKKTYTFNDMFANAGSGKNVYFSVITIADTWHLTPGTENASSYDSGSNTYTYKKTGASGSSKRNGYLQSKFSLSSALGKAMQNGMLSIKMAATVGTVSQSSKDKADTVVMSFAGQSASAVTEFGSVAKELTTSTYMDEFEWKVAVTHNQRGTMTTSANTMTVQNPVVTITTTDLVGPSFNGYTADIATSTWVQSRQITYTITDTDAGIDYVTVNGEKLTPVFTDSTQKQATVTFTVDQNEKDYTLVAYDNVGNASEPKIYRDNRIDIIAPTIDEGSEVDAGVYAASKIVEFALLDTQAGINWQNITVNGVKANASMIDSTNSKLKLTVTQNNQVFDIVVVDNAGNSTNKKYTYGGGMIDTAAPEFDSYSITDEVKFTQTKIGTVVVTDELSGVKSAKVEMLLDAAAQTTQDVEVESSISENGKTITFSFEITKNNQPYIITVLDNVGNEFRLDWTSSYIDTIASSIGAVVVDNSTWARQKTATVSVEDTQAGVREVEITSGGNVIAKHTVDSATSGQYDFVVSDNGQEFLIKVTDSAGNTTATTYTYNGGMIDITTPTIGEPNLHNPTVYEKSKTVEFVVSDAASGLGEIKVNNGENTPEIVYNADRSQATVTITINQNGKIYTLLVIDSVGNQKVIDYSCAMLDLAAPVISDSTIQNDGVWTQSKVVTIALNDERSGIDLASIVLNNGEDVEATYTTDDKKNATITFTVTENKKAYSLIVADLLGNSSEYKGFYTSEYIDTVAPVIGTFDIQNATNYTKSKIVIFEVSDAHAGVEKVLINNVEAEITTNTDKLFAQFEVTDNGQEFVVELFDIAGNKSESAFSYSSNMIDITAPSVEAIVVTDPTKYTNQKTATVSIYDSQIGVASIVINNGEVDAVLNVSQDAKTATATFVITQNEKVFAIVVTDILGNTSVAFEYTSTYIDTVCPVITAIKVDESVRLVYTKSKTVSFVTTDAVAGIESIAVYQNGNEVTSTPVFGTNNKSASVTFDVNINAVEYVIKVIDTAGNLATQTYTSSFIDVTAPVVRAGFESGRVYRNHSVELTVIIDESVIQSSEEYYYTIDDTDPKTSDTRKVLNLSNIEEMAEGLNYTFWIYAVDAVGNEYSEQIMFAVQYVRYDYTIYVEYRGSTPSKVERASATQVLADTWIECVIEDRVEVGGIVYSHYQTVYNDELVNITDDRFLLDCDTIVTIVYRERVDAVFTQSKYTMTNEVLDIAYDYDGQYPIEFTITQNGETAEFLGIGVYDVSYDIDTADYVGSNSAQLHIFDTLSMVVNNLEYTYSEDTFVLDTTLDKDVDYSLTFTSNGGATFTEAEAIANSLDAGRYSYKFVITDPDYYLVATDYVVEAFGYFVINKKTVSLPEFEYNATYSGVEYQPTEYSAEYNVVFAYTQSGNTVSPVNVGEYVVTVTVDEKNYMGSMVGSLVINKKVLEIIADAKQTEYGESVLALTYTVDGFVLEEDYQFSLVSRALLGEAGEFDITLDTDSIPLNSVIKNYEINYTSAKYVITKKNATVTILSNQSKEYGAEDPESYLYTTTGVLEGDDLGVLITREAGENTGSYELTLDSYTNDNYEVTFEGESFKITTKKLIVTANSATKVYDGTDSVPALSYSVLYGTILPQDEANFDIDLVCDAGADVGSYLICASGQSNQNYNVIFMNDYLYVTPLDVTVVADAMTKSFGSADPELTYTVRSSKNLDFDFEGSLSRQAGENVGEYLIRKGTLKNPNYNITFVPAKFAITKADVTVNANDVTKIYGDIDPVFSINAEGVDLSRITGTLTREAGENVGEYTISGQLSSDCYNVTVQPAKLTIMPKTAYIYLASQTKTFGTSDLAVDFALSGVLESDLESVKQNVVISRQPGENVGEYIISAQCEDQNYTFISGSAILTITKATPTLSLSDVIYTYDGEAKQNAATLSIDGDITYKLSKNGESVSEAIDAGEYKVEASFAGNANYNAVSCEAYIYIQKADIEVKVFKDIFVVKSDQSIQDPEISCDLSSSEYRIVFDDLDAGSVGKHSYTIIFNNANYNSIRGQVEILPVPANATEGGSVEFVEGDVEDSNITLQIKKTEDKQAAGAATNMVVDSTYEIQYNQSSNAQVKVELDYFAEDYSNVYVYAYNDKGEAKLVPYQVIDGKIVLSMDAENIKVAIVREVAGISLATVAAIVIICLAISTSYVRRRKKKKMKRLLRVG